jgi:hypothetical protein
MSKPSSRDPGFFSPIDLVAFQTGVATYMTALREGVPLDPEFPGTSFDPVTRKTWPLQDNPSHAPLMKPASSSMTMRSGRASCFGCRR